MAAAGNATAAPTTPARACAWGSLVMLALAFAWFWPTLHHGLRSDDYLVTYYTDRLGGAVLWDRVFAEFGRPWFDGGELWRPLVSVSYGVEMALFPSPTGRHACNVLLVGIAAAATAATAGLLAEHRRLLATLVAGSLVVLHPASVETAAWIAARVTNLQMALCALSAWCYTRHLVCGRRLWPAVLLHALALASKEGAVTLPVTLLAIDLLHDGKAGLRARVLRLLPFGVLLAAYFAWRLYLLGHIGSAEHPFALANLGNVAVRTAQLLSPPDGNGAVWWWPLLLLAGAWLPLWRRLGPWLLALPPWFFLVLSPTQHLAAAHGTLYGRFVFDALPGLGLVLGLAVAGPFRRLGATAAALAAAGWLATLGVVSQQWLARFGAEDQQARASERAVWAAAASATDDRPFACTGLPYLPVFHQKLWGVLGLFPFAPRDLPVIGLPELLVPDEKAPQFRYDAAPIHAILAAGGSTGRLDHTTMQFVPIAAATAGSLRLLAQPGAGREFVAPGAWSGTAVAAIEVRLPHAARELALRFLDDLPTEHAFGTLRCALHGDVAWLSTTHALAPVLLAGVGMPFRGIHLEIDGGDPPAGTQVTVHATLPVRPLAQRNGGKPRSRDELFALSLQPPAPERLRLYVMLPTGVRHMEVPADGAPMRVELREHLRWALDLFAPLTVHWFWQTPPDAAGPPWRSEIDRAVAR